MKPESKELLDKMNRLIADADTLMDAIIVERYISLANRRLRKDTAGEAGIAGASLAIKHNYEDKFNTFIIRDQPIRLGVDVP